MAPNLSRFQRGRPKKLQFEMVYLACMLLVKRKQINRVIQMPSRLLLIPKPSGDTSPSNATGLSDDPLIIGLMAIFQSQICIIGHLRDIFSLNAIINDLPITPQEEVGIV